MSVKRKLRDFDGLRSLRVDDKAKIETPFIEHATRLARFQTGARASRVILSVVYSIVWVAFGRNLLVESWSLLIGIYVGVYLLIFALAAGTYVIRVRWFTDSFLVVQLLDLIKFIEDNGDRWLQLEFRRQVIEKLEKVARIIERDIPRALRGRDPITKCWIRNRTAQTAAGIRDLKTWLVIPTPLTRNDLLTKKLAPTFVAAVTGEWDRMEKVSSERRTDISISSPLGKAATWARNVAIFALLFVSVYVQTEAGQNFLKDRGANGHEANNVANIATLLSSLLATLFLHQSYSGSSKLIPEDQAKKAAEAVMGPQPGQGE
jgi:hypothetical protein